MITSPYEAATQFIGIGEVQGMMDNELILAMLKLDAKWPTHDETPWCSAFINFICHVCKVPRSKSLAARSWLNIGKAIMIEDAKPGFDVVILERGSGGHVGFYVAHNNNLVMLLGGNQGDRVSVSSFPRTRILGIRRIEENA